MCGRFLGSLSHLLRLMYDTSLIGLHMDFSAAADDVIWISNLGVDCVVGCNPDERGRNQPIVATIGLHGVDLRECGATDDLHATVNYAVVAKRVVAYCEGAGCYTLEALATGVAAVIFSLPECSRVSRVSVRIDKPKAFNSLVAVPGVQITRSRDYFGQQRMGGAAQSVAAAEAALNASNSSGHHPTITAYLAVGSNLGDRVGNIEAAVQLLEDGASTGASTRGAFLRVVDTSWLYETPAAYVTDQPPFINGALRVETNLTPLELLRHIKANVEGALGREKSIRFGPRCIDVDIAFYGEAGVVLEAGGDGGGEPLLQIPHPRIAERDFVLGPLADICAEYVHPLTRLSVAAMLRRLPSVALQRVLPLHSLHQAQRTDGGGGAPLLLQLGARTHIMGIVNVTPDSFSDGGEADGIDAAVARGLAMAADGAVIIDVGGQSTRPGASHVSPDEEAARVLPVVRALRAALPPAVAISVDTFYASVAAGAVAAGATLVNDVSGGTRDGDMLATVAKLRVRRGGGGGARAGGEVTGMGPLVCMAIAEGKEADSSRVLMISIEKNSCSTTIIISDYRD